jgi:hypothetical protein
VTGSSWDIYQAQHSPAKWIGTVEPVDKEAAIEKAAELFNAKRSEEDDRRATRIGPR